MAVVEKSVLVFYSARQMFVLVDRVEDYPVFLPWCGGTEVQRISDDVLEATFLPENVGEFTNWGLANGITSVAKTLPYAADGVELARVAGQVLVAR